MPLTRRTAIAGFAIAAASFAFAMQAPAQAGTTKFSLGKYNSYLKSGRTFMIGVHADWCSTCARQKRVINSLRSKGAPYKGLTVLEMDWDKSRRSSVVKKLNIPRRSTLIMYKKGKEVGRIVAGTSTSQIKQLIDKAY